MANETSRRICVIGLGYVGLPVAVAFAARVSGRRGSISIGAGSTSYAAGIDRTLECSPEELARRR